MLTPARLREYTGPSGVLDLLRDLGYPIAPIDIDPAEWRRGGVSIPWNGEAQLTLAARLPRFDSSSSQATVARNRSRISCAVTVHTISTYEISARFTYTKIRSRYSISRCRTRAAAARRRSPPSQRARHRSPESARVRRPDETSLPRIFDRALDRESVTREFFQRFRARCSDVAARSRIVPNEEREAVDAEALLILSRLLFLSFMQEKGWLNGERRFLVDRLEQETRRGREFFSDVLAAALLRLPQHAARERTFAARDSAASRISTAACSSRRRSSCAIRSASAERADAARDRGRVREVRLPIDESDAAGTHVDPEMLGKVFESLMAADERAASGSFYTPKEIVDVLVERAIAEWLGRTPTAASRSSRGITVLDPACGSGAFLLSALGVRSSVSGARTRRADRGAARSAPAHRRALAVRRRSQAEAVRLCELRLWLAIVSAATRRSTTSSRCRTSTATSFRATRSSARPTSSATRGRASTRLAARAARAARSDRALSQRAACGAARAVSPDPRQRSAARLRAAGARIDEAERELQRAARRSAISSAARARVDPERCRELQQRIAEEKRMLEASEEGARLLLVRRAFRARDGARRFRRRRRQSAVGAQQPHRAAREADADGSLRAVPRTTRRHGVPSARSVGRVLRARAVARGATTAWSRC
jgi:hypothetical protein